MATGKNGREVGRVSIRVLPNMDNFRRLAEKQISNTKPLSVDVEADMNHFERDMERKTRKRSTTVNVVADTKRFYNHLKKATSLAPSVKVAVEAVPTNFKVPEVPDLQLKINDSAALKQLSQFSNKLVKESRKWQVNAPSLGVTGKAPNVPKTSVNQVFSEDDFLKPLAIIKQIHAELGKRARARVLDDLNRGLDFVTSKAGDARNAFREVYADKFKPRFVDPFTAPFAKGAANARRFMRDVRQEFNEGVADMRDGLKDLAQRQKDTVTRQKVRVVSSVQSAGANKELKARKPDLSGYQEELEALKKVFKARQRQFMLENQGKKNQAVGYHREITEVEKLLERTKKLRDNDIIGRKAVKDAVAGIKDIDKRIVDMHHKMALGEITEVKLKKGRKQDPNAIIDVEKLRVFEKEYSTAFSRISQKARGEFNRINNAMAEVHGRARQLQQLTAKAGSKVAAPVKSATTKVKSGVSTQVNKIKDVWDSSTSKRYRKAWAQVGRDTGKNLKSGFANGLKSSWKYLNDTDGAIRKMRGRLDGLRATKDVFNFKGLRKALGFADKSTQKYAKRTVMGLTRIGWIATAVGAIAAPAIGLVGGALAALPALGVAGVAAISLVALGMDGIKEAAQAAAPEFNNLKDSISQIYADGLVSQFEQLGGVIAKTQPAMENVARATMVAGQGFTNAVSSGRGVDLINKSLNNTAGLFESIQPFTQGFTMGLLEMAGAGSETFDGLADSLNNFGTDFETSMRDMAESGVLQDAITATFDILGSMGSNLGSILAAGMEQLPNMVGPLTTLLDGLGSGLVGLMPVLTTMTNGVAETLGTLFAELGNVGTAIAPGFEAGFMGLSDIAVGFITGISSVLQSVAPMFNGLMQGLAPHMESIGGSLASFGDGFATAFEPFAGPLGQHVQSIADAIGGPLAAGFERLSELGPVFGEGLGEALTNAAPGVTSLVEALAPLIEGNMDIIAGFLEGFIQTLPAIGEGVGLVAGAIAGLLAHPLTQTLMEWVQNALAFLAPMAGWVAGFAMLIPWIMRAVAVFKVMMNTIQAVRIAFGLLKIVMMANPMVALVAVIMLVVGALVHFFTNTEKGREIWDKFTSFLSSAWETASTAVTNGIQAIKDWWNETVEDIKTRWQETTDRIQELFTVVQEAIRSKIDDIKEAWNNGLQAIKDAITSVNLVESGKALIRGFIDGIKSMISAVGDAAKAVVDKAREFFPFSPAKRGPFAGKGWVLYSGRSIGQAFAQGMLDERSTVAAAAKSLTKAAAVPFDGNLGNTIEHQKRKAIRDEVLEKNAEKIAKAREEEAEAEKKAAERIAEIRKSNSKQASKEKQIAKVRADLAKKNAERQKELHESLEAPDYSQINRSFEEYWIGGIKDLFKSALMNAVDDFGLVAKTKGAVKESVAAARKVFGNHPIFDKALATVNSDSFEWAVKNSIEESGLAEVPVNLVISNLDQFKSDLGMGDGVLSRAIDEAMKYDPANTDSKRYKESQEKTEVHYHVADMNEAIRLENLRERKQMMKMKK